MKPAPEQTTDLSGTHIDSSPDQNTSPQQNVPQQKKDNFSPSIIIATILSLVMLIGIGWYGYTTWYPNYLAKQFVTAAAHNTLCNLKYHQNRKANIGDYIEYIEEIVKELDEVEDVDELMGYEGMIKRAYYEAWKEIFNYPIDFYKRVKNPPDNLINSLISYGNMIVYGVCINEIYQTKLYPEISFLHEPSEARLSLCFDIAEMFKPLLTDRIIFKVINKNMISPKDAFTKNGFCRLSKNAKKIYAQEFELKLNTKIKLKDKSNKLTYKTLIREECYKLHKHITEKEKYIAYKSKW